MMTRRKNRGRLNTRVDFTPMVDMMMLLLTFFMFCTTLSKPQIMDLAMPAPVGDDVPNPPNVGSQAITLILADANAVYYYEGVADYEDYASVKKINYEQLRDVLVAKNKQIVMKINDLTKKRNAKEISEEAYQLAIADVKKDKKGAVAVIKPMAESNFQNLIDVLDEMAICSVGRYAVLDMTDGDDFLVKNYESKGLYAQENTVNF